MPVEPALGWTLLSAQALRKASEAMASDGDGVVDEVGFLALHRAYANRFFPGTSVLHTRLRYALFVPWIYEDLRDISKEKLRQELRCRRCGSPADSTEA